MGFYGLEGTDKDDGINYLPLNIQDKLSFDRDKTIKITEYKKVTDMLTIFMWGDSIITFNDYEVI